MVGHDVGLAELRQRHDAVLIAAGVYKARDIAAPGVGLPGVAAALDYLTASNRAGLGDKVPAYDSGALNAKGKHVVVVGGGDTAMDCVRTAVRQGAKSVKCLYRRDRPNMPGSQREVKHAEEEGVEFIWLTAPQSFLGKDIGQDRYRHRSKLQLPLIYLVNCIAVRMMVIEIALAVHMEADRKYPFTIGQFFAVWGVKFSDDQLGSYRSKGDEQVRAYVNGKRISDPVNYVMKEGDEIAVGYGKPGSFPSNPPGSFPPGA